MLTACPLAETILFTQLKQDVGTHRARVMCALGFGDFFYGYS